MTDTSSGLSPELVERVARAIHDDCYRMLSPTEIDESWTEFCDEGDLANPFIGNARAALSAALPILREQEFRRMLERLEFPTEHGKFIKAWVKHYAKSEHGLDLEVSRANDGER